MLLMKAFNSRYEPADGIEDCTDMISNSEILALFNDSTEIHPDALTLELSNIGYKVECIDMKFVWLLKDRAGN